METKNVNPATYLGFGTWVLWGAGRVPVGVNIDDTDFATVEKTGGEKTHKLTSNEIPKNIARTLEITTGKWSLGVWKDQGQTTNTYSVQLAGQNGLAEGEQVHNNLPPYITCYMWKRTA